MRADWQALAEQLLKKGLDFVNSKSPDYFLSERIKFRKLFFIFKNSGS
jgi:hypothetical protein